jgi:hypothetical protein
MGNGPACTLLNTISPQNAGGATDGAVSGVAIGAAGTLYIGCDRNIHRRAAS